MLARYMEHVQPLIAETVSAQACELFDRELLLLPDTPDARAFCNDGDLDALVRLVQSQSALEDNAVTQNFILRVGSVSVARVGLGTLMFYIRMLDGGSLKHEPQICIIVPKKRLMVLSNVALRILESVVSRHAAMEDFDRTKEERWVVMLAEYNTELANSGVLEQIQQTQYEVRFMQGFALPATLTLRFFRFTSTYKC